MKRPPFKLWRVFQCSLVPIGAVVLAWLIDLAEDFWGLDMRPTSPILSVIVPCYNCEKWLSETLDSLSAQTFKDFSVLFIDDGSKKPIVLDDLKRQYSGDIRLFRHARNKGLSAARNTGAMLAKQSRFIVFLDPDDLIEPAAFEKLLLKASLIKDPRCAFIYPGVTNFRIQEADGHRQIISVDRTPYSKAALWNANFITSFALIKRAEYMAAGGMCERRIRWWEDYDFWLRLSVLGYHGELMGDPVFWYRRHGLGRSSYINLNIREDYWRMELTRNNPRDLPQVDDDPELVDRLTPPPCYREVDGSCLTIISRLSRSFSLMMKRSYATERSAYTALRDLGFRPEFQFEMPQIVEKETVMLIIPWMQIGGADTYDLDMIAALSKHYHILIVTEIDQQFHHNQDAFKKFTSDIFQLPTLTDDQEEQANAILLHLTRTRNVKHIYCRNSFAGYNFIKFMTDKGLEKAAIRFYDVQHLYTLEDQGGWEHTTIPYHKYLDKRIVISQDLLSHQQKLLGEVGSGKFSIIPPSIDLRKWAANSACESTEWTVMFIGRVDEQKDPLKWLQVAKILKTEITSIKFTVIGDGPLLQQMRHEAEDLSADIEFSNRYMTSEEIKLAMERGRLTEGPCRRSLLLLTSRNEGLPIVIMEAIAMGLNVIAPPIGAIHEMLKHSKYLLQLSKSTHVYDLAGATLDLIRRNPLRNEPGQCQASFEENYGRESFSTRIRSLFTL